MIDNPYQAQRIEGARQKPKRRLPNPLPRLLSMGFLFLGSVLLAIGLVVTLSSGLVEGILPVPSGWLTKLPAHPMGIAMLFGGGALVASGFWLRR